MLVLFIGFLRSFPFGVVAGGDFLVRVGDEFLLMKSLRCLRDVVLKVFILGPFMFCVLSSVSISTIRVA